MPFNWEKEKKKALFTVQLVCNLCVIIVMLLMLSLGYYHSLTLVQFADLRFFYFMTLQIFNSFSQLKILFDLYEFSISLFNWFRTQRNKRL